MFFHIVVLSNAVS